MDHPDSRDDDTESNTLGRGVITLGFGHERYRRMAMAMARSVRLHNPDLPLAVVTDHLEDTELARHFDKLIPLDPAYGPGIEQKLSIDRYSPFEHTLFVDADCLVTQSLDHTFELLGAVPFGVVGFPVVDGFYWGEVEEWKRRFGVPYLGKFNAGVMCFRGPEGRAVYETARSFVAAGLTDGVPLYRDGLVEEVFLAPAMAKHGLIPIYDDGRVMRAPEPLESRIFLDVANGVGRFKTKGKWVEPAVVHLAYLYHGPGLRGSVYRREMKRLLDEPTTAREALTCAAAQAVFAVEGSTTVRNTWKRYRGGIRRAITRGRTGST